MSSFVDPLRAGGETDEGVSAEAVRRAREDEERRLRQERLTQRAEEEAQRNLQKQRQKARIATASATAGAPSGSGKLDKKNATFASSFSFDDSEDASGAKTSSLGPSLETTGNLFEENPKESRSKHLNALLGDNADTTPSKPTQKGKIGSGALFASNTRGGKLFHNDDNTDDLWETQTNDIKHLPSAEAVDPEAQKELFGESRAEDARTRRLREESQQEQSSLEEVETLSKELDSTLKDIDEDDDTTPDNGAKARTVPGHVERAVETPADRTTRAAVENKSAAPAGKPGTDDLDDLFALTSAPAKTPQKDDLDDDLFSFSTAPKTAHDGGQASGAMTASDIAAYISSNKAAASGKSDLFD